MGGLPDLFAPSTRVLARKISRFQKRLSMTPSIDELRSAADERYCLHTQLLEKMEEGGGGECVPNRWLWEVSDAPGQAAAEGRYLHMVVTYILSHPCRSRSRSKRAHLAFQASPRSLTSPTVQSLLVSYSTRFAIGRQTKTQSESNGPPWGEVELLFKTNPIFVGVGLALQRRRNPLARLASNDQMI